MTWITTTPEHEATGALAGAYARVREQNGATSNITRAASIHPRVMQALAELLHALHCALPATVLTAVMPLLSGLQPRMASEHSGPEPTRGLEPAREGC